MDSSMVSYALSYARKGWVVFPCKPDKAPYTRSGFKDASKDEEQIKSWWVRWPDAMIGVATGTVSGIWVLDVDIAKKEGDIPGADSLAELIRERGPLPRTLREKTPSGGEHYYFRMPVTGGVRNRAKFLPGLDVRAEGGYIIIAPSCNDKGAYELVDDTEPVFAPDWLLEIVAARGKNTISVAGDKDSTGKPLYPYVEKALQDSMDAIAKAEMGVRNDMLFKNVAAMAGFIPYGFLDVETLRQRAAEAYAQCNPEGFDQEFDGTFMSAVEHGKQNPKEVPASLPRGFKLVRQGVETGVWYDKPAKGGDGEPVRTRIGAPLVVRGYIRDGDSENWGKLVEWRDPDGVKHTLPFAAEQLTSGDGGWKTVLAQGGYQFSGGKGNQDLINQYLIGTEPVMRFVGANRTGWHNEKFVLPDEAIPKTLTGPIVLVNAPKRNPYAVAGTLADWREYAGKLACGNGRLIFALCIAFAPPLLYLLGQESVGFNFVGSSSIGKSTALLLAATVWGKGSSGDGYVLPWRSTDNALEAQAALHSDTLLCLDEMSQAPARVVSEAAYMLGNNQGKARANRRGDSREIKNWRVMFLSTGEQGLEDKLREDGRAAQAGQAVRLIDIPADAGAGYGVFENIHDFASAATMADELKLACATYYGTASRAFINRVIALQKASPALLQEMLRRYSAALCPTDADGQVKRASAKFALCQVAGQIAALASGSAGAIMPVGKNEIDAAVAQSFAAWLDLRGGNGALEVKQIVERAMAFVQTQSSRFEDLHNGDLLIGKIPNRAGFKSVVDEEKKVIFYVLPEVFKNEICKGMPPVKAARILADQGVLVRGEDSRLQCRLPHDVKELGRARVYAINVYDKM